MLFESQWRYLGPSKRLELPKEERGFSFRKRTSSGPDPMKADEWLEQIVKSFAILDIQENELWVELVAY